MSQPRYVPLQTWIDLYEKRKISINVKQLPDSMITIESPYTKVIVGVEVNRKESSNVTKFYSSARILKKTELQLVQILYQSGAKVKCKVKYSPDKKDVLLEPEKENLAYIIMDAKDLEKDVNLALVPHIRVYHTNKNNDMVKEWFKF